MMTVPRTFYCEVYVLPAKVNVFFLPLRYAGEDGFFQEAPKLSEEGQRAHTKYLRNRLPIAIKPATAVAGSSVSACSLCTSLA